MASKNSTKAIRILEIVWLVIAVIAILIGTYETLNAGIGESYIFFIFTVIAGIMHTIRKRQRKRMESEGDE